MKFFLWLSLALAVTCAFAQSAHADAIGDIETLYEHVPDDLKPVSAADFSGFENALSACTNGSVNQCIEAVSSTPAFKAHTPSWVVMWIEVYFDLQATDYWALVADAGKAIACTAADVVFGVDICGAIETLVKAAVAIADGVQAALKFMGEVFGAFTGAVAAAYCDSGLGSVFGGCDDGPPQIPPEILAYTNYYYPRLPDGLWNRENSPAAWSNYDNGLVANCSSQPGLTTNGCQKAKPVFEQSVVAAWNADNVQKWIPQVKNRQHDQWTAEKVGSHLGDVPGVPFLDINDPWSFNGFIVKLVFSECSQDLLNQGAQEVQDWMDAGGPDQAKVPYPWSKLSGLCSNFNNAFQQAALKAAFDQGVAQIAETGICSKVGDSPLVYDCKEDAYKSSPETTDCQTVLSLGSLDPSQCFPPKHWDCPGGGGGIQLSIGTNKNVRKNKKAVSGKLEMITLPAHQPPPSGCQNADVSIAAPPATVDCHKGSIYTATLTTQQILSLEAEGCSVTQGNVVGAGGDQNPQCQQLKLDLNALFQNSDPKEKNKTDLAIQNNLAHQKKLGCDAGSQQGPFDPSPK